MVRTYSKAKDGDTYLSKNFKVKEFACNDGSDEILISDELVAILQQIRDHFGKAITINSAYRTKTYNTKIGGATNSQHTKGTAADIVVSGITPKQVTQYVEYLQPSSGGIGLYNSFTHVDVRTNRSRWDNTSGKEVVVSGFPGYEEKEEDIVTDTTNTVETTPWYEEDMEWAKSEGITDGTRPTGNTTRAEVWAMLHRLYNIIKE